VLELMNDTAAPKDATMDDERVRLLRDYAAGAISWSLLRQLGYDNYLDVLAGLGELGLRPPVAPMDGPNREARQRARMLLRQALR
jgi:hypothetical protein